MAPMQDIVFLHGKLVFGYTVLPLGGGSGWDPRLEGGRGLSGPLPFSGRGVRPPLTGGPEPNLEKRQTYKGSRARARLITAHEYARTRYMYARVYARTCAYAHAYARPRLMTTRASAPASNDRERV